MRGVFLLHGFTGAPTAWQAVRGYLPPSTPCTAPWLMGHGIPPCALNVESFSGEVDRLASLIPDGEPVVLGGYSLGARLGLALLLRAPERFSAAVLISGSAGLETEAERAVRREHDRSWRDLLEAEGVSAFTSRWEAQPLFASQTALPTLVRRGERERRLGHTADGLSRSLAVIGLGEMANLAPELGAVRIPVELLAGSEDPRFCTFALDVVRKLPTGRFTQVSGAGHNLLLERPDEVARALLRGILQ
jgi:2-succinyl-6-hydroxy-2,4-cyclohexadiene-1-carboxylate synthase